MILALDTTSSLGQIALYNSSDLSLIQKVRWDTPDSHSEKLTQSFEELKISIDEIEKLFVINGPGSFTGLRVGFTFVKSLSYCHNIPIQTVSSLDAYVLSLDEPHNNIYCIVDAQKNSVFCATYSFKNKILKTMQKVNRIRVTDLAQQLTAKTFFCGPAWNRYKDFLSDSKPTHLSTAIDFHKILSNKQYLQSLDTHSWETIVPNYLRKSAPEELLENRLRS